MASKTDLKTRVAQRAGNGNGESGEKKPSTAVATRDVVRAELERMRPEFEAALPKHIGSDRFLRVALTCVKQTPKLLECDKFSFFAALLESARLGLMPGTKEAALVPFKGKVVFVAQWQGLVQLMYRSGQVDSVVADLIHENDEWSYVPTARPPDDFYWKPNLTGDRGQPILAFAFAWLRGGTRSKVVLLTRRDAEEIRDQYSQSYKQAQQNGKKDSTWHLQFDQMWRKSAVRRLADWVPSSPELLDLLTREDAAGELVPTRGDTSGGYDVIDVDPVEERDDTAPASHEPTTEQEAPAAEQPQPAQEPPAEKLKSLSGEQKTQIQILFRQIGWTDRDDRIRAISAIVGRDVDSSKDLTGKEASELIDALKEVAQADDPPTALEDAVERAIAAEAQP